MVSDDGPECIRTRWTQVTRAGIQLYTLRAFDEPLEATIERVAAAGFDGVEFAHGIVTADPVAVRDALDDTGLTPIGAHVELDTLEASWKDRIVRYDRIGCDRIIIPHLPPVQFHHCNRITELAKRLASTAVALDERGFELGIHNTQAMLTPPLDRYGLGPLLSINRIPSGGWTYLAMALARFSQTIGELPVDWTGFSRLLESFEDEPPLIEIDIKNVVAAGIDPETIFTHFGGRTPLVHLADIDRSRRVPPKYESVDPGDGIVDLDAALETAVRHQADWVIFEHDRPSDPEVALEQASETMAPLLS